MADVCRSLVQAQQSRAVATKNFKKQENDTPHFRIISDEQLARACAHRLRGSFVNLCIILFP
jgi:hypothetical protein